MAVMPSIIERLWRSLTYECVCLHTRDTGSQAQAGIAHGMTFYNPHRPHSALGGTPPAVFYRRAIPETQTDRQVQNVA
jgi:putative transposase